MFGWGLKKKARVAAREIRYFTKNLFSRPRLYSHASPERFGAIYHEPSDMCLTDRAMLYALVRGLRPARALEIGARWGGSARIITAAMEDNQFGRAAGIDPEPSAFRAKPNDLHNRYQLITGYSPEAIPKAVEVLGGPLDFVFVDALHTFDAVLADFRGSIPHLAPGAHVLLHDTYHQGIDAAAQAILKEHPAFVDCGFITRNPKVGEPVSYQGLRLIRCGELDSQGLIADAYKNVGKTPPPFSTGLWNYDPYANRIGKGAPPAPAEVSAAN